MKRMIMVLWFAAIVASHVAQAGTNNVDIVAAARKKASDGTPLVIHNIGAGTKEENSLFTCPLTGHYRMKK